MLRLPDEAEAWARRWRERLTNDEAFAEKAAGFDADFLFEIRPDDDYGGDPVRFVVVFDDGDAVEARPVGDDVDFDFALRGPYGAWKELLDGDLDVSAAVMSGPFEVDGSTLTLLNYREAIAEMVAQARAIDTSFR